MSYGVVERDALSEGGRRGFYTGKDLDVTPDSPGYATRSGRDSTLSTSSTRIGRCDRLVASGVCQRRFMSHVAFCLTRR